MIKILPLLQLRWYWATFGCVLSDRIGGVFMVSILHSHVAYQHIGGRYQVMRAVEIFVRHLVLAKPVAGDLRHAFTPI